MEMEAVLVEDGATLTVEEAARLLRVHPETVLRALRAGKLPGGKVGGQWRISRSALEEHLSGRSEPKAEGGGGR